MGSPEPRSDAGRRPPPRVAGPSTLDVVRFVPVLAAVYLTLGTGWLLVAAGISLPRLAVAAVVLAFGWIGAAGAVTRRFRPVLGGAAGLVVVGFLQAVLWVFMFPTALVLLAVGLVMWRSGDVRV